jgi:hypothetical protein
MCIPNSLEVCSRLELDLSLARRAQEIWDGLRLGECFRAALVIERS